MRITKELIEDKLKFIDEQIKVYKKIKEERREERIIEEYRKEKKIYEFVLKKL